MKAGLMVVVRFVTFVSGVELTGLRRWLTVCLLNNVGVLGRINKMAICNWCKNDMNDVDTCQENMQVEYPDGSKLPSSTEHFDEESGRCHDCAIKHGGFHHPGCDVERCPKCLGQLITCGCLDEEDDDE
jgi:hypothetical protein